MPSFFLSVGFPILHKNKSITRQNHYCVQLQMNQSYMSQDRHEAEKQSQEGTEDQDTVLEGMSSVTLSLHPGLRMLSFHQLPMTHHIIKPP